MCGTKFHSEAETAIQRHKTAARAVHVMQNCLAGRQIAAIALRLLLKWALLRPKGPKGDKMLRTCVTKNSTLRPKLQSGTQKLLLEQ